MDGIGAIVVKASLRSLSLVCRQPTSNAQDGASRLGIALPSEAVCTMQARAKRPACKTLRRAPGSQHAASALRVKKRRNKKKEETKRMKKQTNKQRRRKSGAQFIL